MTANEILETVALPQTMLGHNLAVAGALEFAKRKGYAAGFCDGQDTASCWDCEGYRDESPDLDKRITARGERERRK